jgi:hypothetical protein
MEGEGCALDCLMRRFNRAISKIAIWHVVVDIMDEDSFIFVCALSLMGSAGDDEQARSLPA